MFPFNNFFNIIFGKHRIISIIPFRCNPPSFNPIINCLTGNTQLFGKLSHIINFFFFWHCALILTVFYSFCQFQFSRGPDAVGAIKAKLLYLDNSSTCFDSAQHKSLGIKVKDVAAKKEILGLLLKRICIKKAANGRRNSRISPVFYEPFEKIASNNNYSLEKGEKCADIISKLTVDTWVSVYPEPLWFRVYHRLKTALETLYQPSTDTGYEPFWFISGTG
jgi:hypothetical protein